MNRKDFISLNFLNLVKFRKAKNNYLFNKINEGLYESYDSNTGEHVTFSKVTNYLNGFKISHSDCDGVIYIKIGKLFFKRNYYGPINIKWFGAKGNGIVDDTNSFKKALSLLSTAGYQSGGGSIYVPLGNYKITSSILINRSQVKIIGAGIDLTFIEPTGDFEYAFQYVGSSYDHWLNAVELKDLTIKAKDFSGSGLKVEYVGLRSLFENINIFDCGNKGIYCKGSFDHTYHNIEVRGCGNYGLHIYEQNKRTNANLRFEENSFLIFDNIRPIANHKNGIQWLIQGGDSFRLINCKPSEGLVGLRLDCLANRFEISGFYIDGSGIESTGIQIDDEYTRSINIQNLSVFRVRYAVEIINGRGISIDYVQIENDNNFQLGKAVYVHSTCVGDVYYNGYNDNYSNRFVDRSNNLSTSLKFIGNKNVDGEIEKPLTAKVKTMTVKVMMKEGSNTSDVINVKLLHLFKQIFYVGNNINNIGLLGRDKNYPNIMAYSSVQNLSSINVVVRILDANFTVSENVVIDVQLMIVGDVIIK